MNEFDQDEINSMAALLEEHGTDGIMRLLLQVMTSEDTPIEQLSHDEARHLMLHSVKIL